MYSEDFLTMDGLVKALLNLEPEALARLGGQEPTESDVRQGSLCRVGFNVMLRRVLSLHLALLPQENAVLRLETEPSAKTAGWPDARTANVALLLAWGLFGEERKFKGLPIVPLLKAEANVACMVQQRPPGTLETASALMHEIQAPLEVSVEKERRGNALWANPDPVPQAVESTNNLIKDLLGLDPLVLAKGVPWFRDEPAAFFERDAERKGWVGLNKLMRDVLLQYAVMERRRTEEVRLMGEHDAHDAGRPDARSANVATLLSAGLMCEDYWEILFLPARPYSQAREDLLMDMAREVVHSKSMLAHDGFQMICDDMVHHGVHDGPPKSSRLISAAYEELNSDRNA